MNATLNTDILDATLIPFIRDHYTRHHRFQQDNDPKHTSRWAQNYFATKQINWWRTPPSRPDLNTIENVWGSMKEYLRRVVKPHNTEQLTAGIREFWGVTGFFKSLDTYVRTRYSNMSNHVTQLGDYITTRHAMHMHMHMHSMYVWGATVLHSKRVDFFLILDADLFSTAGN